MKKIRSILLRIYFLNVLGLIFSILTYMTANDPFMSLFFLTKHSLGVYCVRFVYDCCQFQFVYQVVSQSSQYTLKCLASDLKQVHLFGSSGKRKCFQYQTITIVSNKKLKRMVLRKAITNKQSLKKNMDKTNFNYKILTFGVPYALSGIHVANKFQKQCQLST